MAGATTGELCCRRCRSPSGLYAQKTDARGQFRLWPLSTVRPGGGRGGYRHRSRSPLWLPTFSGIELSPLPNRFTTLDIPVLSGGVIEGRVVRVTSTGHPDVAGATLVMRHQGTGKERRVTTFTDGFVLRAEHATG